jgi:UTP--glucose-1-phosphate uridylyltransferase
MTKITKALIPVAGLGTRFFPASQACKKEMFPVIGSDGVARALLHFQILDLLNAGVEQICLIVQPGEDQTILQYFKAFIDNFGSLKNGERFRTEAEQIRSVLDCLAFVNQDRQEGYGHAVYQGRAFAAGEPVLLCLGDHLFRGKTTSCHRQLIQAFERCDGKTVSAVNRIRPEALKGYGTIAGKRLEDTPALIRVSKIVEKPSIEVAARELRVDGLAADEFLGWFGMHALSPTIFDVLEEMIAKEIRQNGEIQLTYAQELQRQREGYFALEIEDGRRFDFGTPQDYITSIAEYARL